MEILLRLGDECATGIAVVGACSRRTYNDGLEGRHDARFRGVVLGVSMVVAVEEKSKVAPRTQVCGLLAALSPLAECALGKRPHMWLAPASASGRTNNTKSPSTSQAAFDMSIAFPWN